MLFGEIALDGVVNPVRAIEGGFRVIGGAGAVYQRGEPVKNLDDGGIEPCRGQIPGPGRGDAGRLSDSGEVDAPLDLEKQRQLSAHPVALGRLDGRENEGAEILLGAGQRFREAVFAPRVLERVPDVEKTRPLAVRERGAPGPAERSVDLVGHLDERHPLLESENVLVVQAAAQARQGLFGVLDVNGVFAVLRLGAEVQGEVVIVRGHLRERFESGASAFHASSPG